MSSWYWTSEIALDLSMCQWSGILRVGFRSSFCPDTHFSLPLFSLSLPLPSLCSPSLSLLFFLFPISPLSPSPFSLFFSSSFLPLSPPHLFSLSFLLPTNLMWLVVEHHEISVAYVESWQVLTSILGVENIFIHDESRPFSVSCTSPS